MARLPQPGSDSGTWGEILNDYLSQVHQSDGSLKSDSVGSTQLQDNAVTAVIIADGTISETNLDTAVQTKLNAVAGTPDWNTITNKPAVIAAGADQAAARTVIGAGTSNLALGTSGTTAAAGNDSRLSDQRTPTDGSVTTAKIVDSNVTIGKLSSGVQTSLGKADTALQSADITGKADDTAVVHLVGSETVTGAKNFTGGLNISGQAAVATNDSRLSDTRTPTDNSVATAKIVDSNVTLTKLSSGVQTSLGYADAANIRSQRLYYIDNYGADPTGVVNSDAALAAARVAMDVNPGVIVFGVGTYLLTQPCPTRFYEKQSVIGQGIGETTINFTGTGYVFEAYDSRAWGSGGPGRGAKWGPFTIDGTGCGANSVGLKLGDMSGITVEARVMNFGNTGCIGVWFYNALTWSERIHAKIFSQRNTQGVVFEKDPSGFNSFGYGKFWIEITANANQDGIVLNNALLYHSELTVVGNFTAGSGNTGTALIIGGTGSSDEAVIQYSELHINIETSGATGTGHKTIMINGTDGQLHGKGILRFMTGNGIAFATGNAKSKTAFSGLINVDSNLGRMSFWQGHRTIGLQTGSSVNISGGTTLYLSTQGNMLYGQLAVGNTTYAVDSGVANKANTGETAVWDILLQQPSSGGSGTVTWPASFSWLTGSAPTLSTTASAYDHIRVTTRDFVTLYAEHVNRSAGGITRSIVSVTSSITLGATANTDYVALVGSGGSPTLPTAVSNTNRYTIKNVHNANITISTTSSQTIEGSTTYDLTPGGSIDVISDNTNWRII